MIRPAVFSSFRGRPIIFAGMGAGGLLRRIPLLFFRRQIRGMLLEEAISYLLLHAGFENVRPDSNDQTIRTGPSGLYVRGRGEDHQADALGQFMVSMPFGNPERLIVEAKCYSTDKVGIDIVRNAVGVLKDIHEFFLPTKKDEKPERPRYHYRYAVFSATPFTANAQRYAYAQDIYRICQNSGHRVC